MNANILALYQHNVVKKNLMVVIVVSVDGSKEWKQHMQVIRSCEYIVFIIIIC